MPDNADLDKKEAQSNPEDKDKNKKSPEDVVKTQAVELDPLEVAQSEIRRKDHDPDKATDFLHKLNDAQVDRESHYLIVRGFANKTNITRSDLKTLDTVSQAYTNVTVIDSNIAKYHLCWLTICGLTDKQLSREDHNWAPIKYEEKSNEYDSVMQSVIKKFQDILAMEEFQGRTELDVIKKYTKKKSLDKIPGDVKSKNSSSSSSNETSASKKAIYLKEKIPREQKEIHLHVVNISKQVKDTDYNPQEIKKKLNRLEQRLDQLAPLVTKLAMLPEDELDEDHVDKYGTIEIWINKTQDEIVDLNCEIQKKIDKICDSNPSKFLQTSLKKRSPPTFNGDILEYTEFKRKWRALVSTLKPDQSSELELLKEHIPDEGKKRIYNVENLDAAWCLLDSAYADVKLISQKLTNKLKSLVLKSSEEHEMTIEIYLEVDYPVKRITDLKCEDVLISDPEFGNTVYKCLHSKLQDRFDFWPRTVYASDWQAMRAFLDIAYQNALSKRSLVESIKSMTIKDTNKSKNCILCGGIGHKQNTCANNINKAVVANVSINENEKKDKVRNNFAGKGNKFNNNPQTANEDNKKMYPNCPECKTPHFFMRKSNDGKVLKHQVGDFSTVLYSCLIMLMKEERL